MSAMRKQLTIADIRMEAVAKLAAGLGLLVVVASFAISFAQLQWIAHGLAIRPEFLTYFFPLVIDGPSVVASALTVALHDRPLRTRAYAWSVLTAFTSLSWLCNSIHAIKAATIAEVVPGPHSVGIVLTIVLSGIPPIGVVLGMHLWAYALRHSSNADQRAEAPAPKTVKQPEGRPAENTKQPPAETATPEKLKLVAPPERTEVVEIVGESDSQPMTGAEAEIAMRAEFDRLVKIDASTKPEASDMHDRLGIGNVKSKATTRRWVSGWYAEYQKDAAEGDVAERESESAATV